MTMLEFNSDDERCPVIHDLGTKGHTQPIVGNTTFNQFALIFGGACAIVTVVLSLFLMFWHALTYSKPDEQKYIIRISSMLICFAVLSWVTTWLSQHNATYVAILMDLYESFVFGGFFLLVVTWFRKGASPPMEKEISRSPDSRNGYTAALPPPPPPMAHPDDLPIPKKYFCLVFQFPGVMIFLTLVTEVSNALGHYCASSDKPRYAHFWVAVLRWLTTMMALIAIIVLTHKKKYLGRLKGFNPRRKLWTFKSIVALRLKQTILFSFLLNDNVVSPTKTLSYQDISVAIPALVVCGECVIWSLLFLWAYNTTPYKIRQSSEESPQPNDGLRYQGGFLGWRAMLDAINITDVLKETFLWPRFLCQ